MKPRGHFLFNVWDRISENEFADVVTQALAVVFPSDPPRFMARIPHGYHDVDRIRDELTAAGFSEISVDTVEDKSRASAPRDVAIALCQGAPVRNEIEARNASRLDEATKAATEALKSRFGNGPIEGRIKAYVGNTLARQAKADLRDTENVSPGSIASILASGGDFCLGPRTGRSDYPVARKTKASSRSGV